MANQYGKRAAAKAVEQPNVLHAIGAVLIFGAVIGGLVLVNLLIWNAIFNF